MLAEGPGAAVGVAALGTGQHPVQHRPAPVRVLLVGVPLFGRTPIRGPPVGVEVRAGNVVGYPGFSAQGADLMIKEGGVNKSPFHSFLLGQFCGIIPRPV